MPLKKTGESIIARPYWVQARMASAIQGAEAGALTGGHLRALVA
jgi:hypothetical protein